MGSRRSLISGLSVIDTAYDCIEVDILVQAAPMATSGEGRISKSFSCFDRGCHQIANQPKPSSASSDRRHHDDALIRYVVRGSIVGVSERQEAEKGEKQAGERPRHA